MRQFGLPRLLAFLFYASGFLLFGLGVGIAHYLGIPVSWKVYILGQMWVTSIQIGAEYLNDTNAILPEDVFLRRRTFLAAFTGFAITASMSVLLFREARLSPMIILTMLVIISGVLIYSLPAFQGTIQGYREILEAIFISNIIPMLAFLLQANSFHPLIPMSTFCLTPLYLAMRIALDLRNFRIKNDYGVSFSLLERVGWEMGMRLHNFLLLLAYLILAIAVLFGFPFTIAIPVFFTLPFALFQVWQMSKISEGSKPNWQLLNSMAVGIYGAFAYLLAFSFWTR